MNPGKLIGFGIFIVVIVLALVQATYVVDPGFRGVLVTLGKVSEEAKPEGFGTKSPFISHLIRVPVRQLTQSLDAECYSSDLQQVNVMLRVLYRIPEGKVVEIYKNYSGDPFDSLIAPRMSALPHQKCYPTEAGDLVASCGKLCARVLGSDQA